MFDVYIIIYPNKDNIQLIYFIYRPIFFTAESAVLEVNSNFMSAAKTEATKITRVEKNFIGSRKISLFKSFN